MTQPINLSGSGPPETVLPLEPDEQRSALAEALEQPADTRRSAVATVVSQWPRSLDGWARLGELGRDDIERYAAFRVGYHRGLDTLRQNGWRGSGYVRWAHISNQGFLRSLEGLRRGAEAIGETDEEERIGHFLRQLDPGWSSDLVD